MAIIINYLLLFVSCKSARAYYIHLSARTSSWIFYWPPLKSHSQLYRPELVRLHWLGSTYPFFPLVLGFSYQAVYTSLSLSAFYMSVTNSLPSTMLCNSHIWCLHQTEAWENERASDHAVYESLLFITYDIYIVATWSIPYPPDRNKHWSSLIELHTLMPSAVVNIIRNCFCQALALAAAQSSLLSSKLSPKSEYKLLASLPLWVCRTLGTRIWVTICYSGGRAGRQ